MLRTTPLRRAASIAPIFILIVWVSPRLLHAQDTLPPPALDALAIVTMIAVDIVTLAVVANNYRVGSVMYP